MSEIILPIVIVSAIGLIAGLGLAIASIVMAVPKDEKAEAIEEILPGANCGACGYSGCSGYALALSKGEAKVGACAPGGEKVANEISEILGVESTGVEKKVAVLHCLGNSSNTQNRVVYQGLQSCASAVALNGGIGSCSYGCVGFGDCEKVCQFDAISIKNGVCNINTDVCTGCTSCAKACPQGLISIKSYKRVAVVKCQNCDKGALTVKACKVGCIGCGMCVKACENGAIKITNFSASIYTDKCTACGKCIEACKRGCIELLK